MALVTAALNYLVYVRTSRGRRLKIFLPQTKTLQKFKDDLEKRLGRKREPTLPMRQLVVKPVSDQVTEDEIRVAFNEHTIEKIEFRTDLLKHRCAILTFPTAERTIAAHSFFDYVRLTESGDKKEWVTVLYPCIAVRDWGRTDSLLTRAELKQWLHESKEKANTDSAKGTPQEVKKASEVAPPKRGYSVTDKDGTPPWKRGRGRSSFIRTSAAPTRGAPSTRGNWRGAGPPSRSAALRSRSSFYGRRAGRGDTFASHDSGDYGHYDDPRGMYHEPDGRFDMPEADYSRRSGQHGMGDYSKRDRYEMDRPRSESHRSSGEPYRSHLDSYRPAAQDPDAIMEERIREQRKQLALQEHLLRQQQIIDDLEIQLRSHVQPTSSTGYDSNIESIGGSQNYSGRGSWNGPYNADYNENSGGRSANYNPNWR